MLLRMSGISKSFGQHRVLTDVDFELAAGEVHLLAGENGAGKSTLIKILGGVHRPDAGRIEIDGQARRIADPRTASEHGIAIIHQELSLIPHLSVADNVMLGREPTHIGMLRRAALHREAERLCAQLGLDLDVRSLLAHLPLGLRQMVEIAKALAANARILVMDEPSSALNEAEVERLFACVAELKQTGRGIIYITHKLEEVYRLADRITVLRDGRRIATAPAADMPPEQLIAHMIGRSLAEKPAAPPAPGGPARLRVENLSVAGPTSKTPPAVADVSLEVRAGEIVGLAGLQGCGHSTLLEAIFGIHGRRTRGRIVVDDHVLRRPTPRRAMACGIALVPSDRQGSGLVAGMSVSANETLAALPSLGLGPLRLVGREQKHAEAMAARLQLRARSLDQPVAELSGGNQQKIVLAKWLLTGPRVLLLDEPTRGVDVGAKEEIYALLAKWRSEGYAMLLTTSELPELLRLSDRIIVMHRGRVTAMFGRAEATREAIMHAAMGAA